MAIFDYSPNDKLGLVDAVDTSTVSISVAVDELLRNVQVNHLVAIDSPLTGQHLIGLVTKIMSKANDEEFSNTNSVKAVLIGTHYDKWGTEVNKFNRSSSTVPVIGAECYLIQDEQLELFMESISSTTSSDSADLLDIGKYSIDNKAPAKLNGNKFFQRHAVIVGSTGSGKSWCVARILEQIANFKSTDAILFDLHGEYLSFTSEKFSHYRIAGPSDSLDEHTLFLPYWLLTYEEMHALLIDRSDNNAPNQASVFSSEVINGKRRFLDNAGKADMSSIITLDSPIPYSIFELIEELERKDNEKVQGDRGEKQGTFYGKLTRFVQRLKTKCDDKRLNFMFNSDDRILNYDYMQKLCEQIMLPAQHGKRGIKIINFSEVPSDILPLIVSLLARLIFSIQQWTEKENRHPIAIFCDEAHLYIPANTDKGVDIASLDTFERIAKEGRKYGVGLVVISQRPSEVNRTVLSQSNNFIAMRLTNADDQNVVKRLLPDSLGDYADMLPILEIGEALIVGDASLLPSRIKIAEPKQKPHSATVEFCSEWAKEDAHVDFSLAIEALRRQSK